jgi:hypothetical protein
MGRTRVSVNRRGVASFLRSPETQALIERKTRAVAEAAAEASEADGVFRVDVEVGERRVRGAVIGDYSTRDPEKSRRALLRALDAARAAE